MWDCSVGTGVVGLFATSEGGGPGVGRPVGGGTSVLRVVAHAARKSDSSRADVSFAGRWLIVFPFCCRRRKRRRAGLTGAVLQKLRQWRPARAPPVFVGLWPSPPCPLAPCREDRRLCRVVGCCGCGAAGFTAAGCVRLACAVRAAAAAADGACPPGGGGAAASVVLGPGATLRMSSSESSPAVNLTRSAVTRATFMPLISSP